MTKKSFIFQQKKRENFFFLKVHGFHGNNMKWSKLAEELLLLLYTLLTAYCTQWIDIRLKAFKKKKLFFSNTELNPFLLLFSYITFSAKLSALQLTFIPLYSPIFPKKKSLIFSHSLLNLSYFQRKNFSPKILRNKRNKKIKALEQYNF